MPGNGQASKYFWMKKRKNENGSSTEGKTKIKAKEGNLSSTSPLAQKSILNFFKRSEAQDKAPDSQDQKKIVGNVTPEPKRRKVEVNKDDKLQEFAAETANNGTEEKNVSSDLPYSLPLPVDLPEKDAGDENHDLILPSSSSKLTPLEQQVSDLKRRHPHLFLFIECGYRYRFFGRDAQIAAKVFDISCHPDRNFLVASVPTFNGPANYVRKLVQEGYKVGIVSQAETAAAKQATGQSLSGPFERKLSAVYSRTGFMGEDVALSACEAMAGDPQGNVKSMVAAINQDSEGRVGMMAVQPTTGEVLYADIEQDDAGKSEFRRCLDYIQPLEVLLPKEGLSKVTEATIELCSRIGGHQYKVERIANVVYIEDDDGEYVNMSDQDTFGQLMSVLSPTVLSCFRVLVKYLKELGLAESLLKSTRVTKLELGEEKMFLPDMTLRNLEVFQTLTPAPSNRGTLLHSMNRTVTRQGARLLKDWIGAPLRSVYEIRQRQNAVRYLLSPHGSSVRNTAKACLSKMLDLEVALTACLCEKIRSADFARMCDSMIKVKDLAIEIANESYKDCPELLTAIFEEISRDFEPISADLKNIDRKAASEGNIESLFIDWSFSPPVLECMDKIKDIEADLERHKKDIKRKLGLDKFEYACVSGLEYLVEVKQNRAAEAPTDWRRMSSTKQVVRFRTPYVLENLPRLVYQREQLGERCREAWAGFIREFNTGYHKLQSCARRVAELDCLISLAEVSAGEGFVCPDILEDKMEITIKAGRNIIVEDFLPSGKSYVPNDTHLGGSDAPIALVLTGPNMGGKSCLGRQIGLISIMAQTGCFIPAESASLPCLDALFVRVGARDDLHARKSTLLVEMEEAALVLRRATRKSLVLMDELGRGTDVTDGAAIAKSVLKNLVEETKCLTVFITHYKAVTEMDEEIGGGKVGNGYMGYLRQGDKSSDVLFLYKLTIGRSADSFGMNVARMAGISEDDMKLAVEKGQMAKQFQDLTQ